MNLPNFNSSSSLAVGIHTIPSDSKRKFPITIYRPSCDFLIHYLNVLNLELE